MLIQQQKSIRHELPQQQQRQRIQEFILITSIRVRSMITVALAQLMKSVLGKLKFYQMLQLPMSLLLVSKR